MSLLGGASPCFARVCSREIRWLKSTLYCPPIQMVSTSMCKNSEDEIGRNAVATLCERHSCRRAIMVACVVSIARMTKAGLVNRYSGSARKGSARGYRAHTAQYCRSSELCHRKMVALLIATEKCQPAISGSCRCFSPFSSPLALHV